MSSTIAVLLDLNFQAEGPATWMDSQGQEWAADLQATTVELGLFSEHVADIIDRHCWQAASKHISGRGLGEPPLNLHDLGLLFRSKRLTKEEAYVMKLAAAGGIWTQSRRRDEGFIKDGTCQRCG